MLNRLKIRLLVATFLIATCNPFYGQYLDTLHITPTQHEFTSCFDWSFSHLTSVACLQDTNWNLYGWNYLEFKQYNDQFDVINEKRLQDSSHVYYPWSEVLFYKNNYYLPGFKNKVFSSDSSKGFLIKYDTVGNIIWEKNYFPSIEDVRINFIQPSGDFLYICGTNYYPSTTNVVETSLSKIDTSGNIIWTKIFGGANQQPVSFKKTLDHGFILSTNYQPSGSNLKTLVYKLDTSGIVKWQKIIGSNLGNQHILTVIETPNNKYIGFGGSSDPNNSTFRSWLVKLDTNGVVLKDTVYDFSNGFDVFSNVSELILKPNGFYVLRSFYESAYTNYPLAGIAFVDYDLKLQWTRQYERRQAENDLVFQKELNNGFIALAGVCFQDSVNNTADEWFLVIDSLGCTVQGCSVGIEEYGDMREVEMNIFPNPSSNFVYIKDSKNIKFVDICDLSGRLLIHSSQNNSSIDVSKLPQGSYICVLHTNNTEIITQKLIIQR